MSELREINDIPDINRILYDNFNHFVIIVFLIENILMMYYCYLRSADGITVDYLALYACDVAREKWYLTRILFTAIYTAGHIRNYCSSMLKFLLQ